MNLKKYIIVDVVTNIGYDPNIDGSERNIIKVKVVEGFIRSEIEEALNVQNTWTPAPNDKLYFFPGCNVPRFKVRDQFVCTIKPGYATAAFISKETLVGTDSTFNHYKNLYPVSIEPMKIWMNDLKNRHTAQLFKSILDNGNIENVFLGEGLWRDYSYQINFTLSDVTVSSGVMNNSAQKQRYNFCDNCYKSEFQLFSFAKNTDLANLKCNIYLEEAILTHLNVGNLVIDETKYNELRAFGQTKENDNLVLMMELMANADLTKSIVYILFLLKEFKFNIISLKEANHVNFKSMLSFIGITRIQDLDNLNIHKMTQVLRNNKQFTRSNAMRLSMLCQNDRVEAEDKDNIGWIKGGVTLNKNVENLLND